MMSPLAQFPFEHADPVRPVDQAVVTVPGGISEHVARSLVKVVECRALFARLEWQARIVSAPNQTASKAM